jgi:hypothetical protein
VLRDKKMARVANSVPEEEVRVNRKGGVIYLESNSEVVKEEEEVVCK